MPRHWRIWSSKSRPAVIFTPDCRCSRCSPCRAPTPGLSSDPFKLDRLDEAFLFARSIDIETYDRHSERLREELTLARIAKHSTELEELDVEGILAFAERVLPRAADLWVQAQLDQRQRFQPLFLSRGIGVRRRAASWNRRNRTGLQLLAGDFGRR